MQLFRSIKREYPKNKNLRKSNSRRKRRIKKAYEFIEPHREQESPKITIHTNPYHYRDKRLSL